MRKGIGVTNQVVDDPYASTTCIYRSLYVYLWPYRGWQLVQDVRQRWNTAGTRQHIRDDLMPYCPTAIPQHNTSLGLCSEHGVGAGRVSAEA